MTFPTKLAFIHPIWFLVLTVVAFVAPLFTMNADIGAMVAIALMSVWVLLLPLGWAHGIYRGSRSALARIGAVGPSRDWVFYIAEVGVVCLPIFGLGSNIVEVSGEALNGMFGFGMLALIASYFTSLWLASAALVASEDGTSKVAIHKVVGTFLLMVYWMIGAWVMQRRLKTMREALTVGGSSVE
ncbi:hypothetical protein [Brevundimonas sp.]|uniref:hypothetical protein n=1 Tax=Brevundimonas sp. TaxID=1871086 RepID=UPI003568EE00